MWGRAVGRGCGGEAMTNMPQNDRHIALMSLRFCMAQPTLEAHPSAAIKSPQEEGENVG